MAKQSRLSPGRPAAKADDFQPVPDDVLHIAQAASKRAQHRVTQIRRHFVRRTEPTNPDPPLAQMLRGGRGGEVRLKVYLTLLWIGSGGKHDVSFPARSYAQLLDLDDPSGNGARRVNDALDWLESHRFITLDRRPGRVPEATLLSDDGTGAPYVVPGGAPKSPDTNKASPANYYFRLSRGFWTRGWAARLPAPAVAMLLVLLAESRSTRADALWISPGKLAEGYAFSDDTRRRGVTVLENTGLIFVGRKPVNEDFGYRRVRNTYSIEPAMLDSPIDPGAKRKWSGSVELFGGPASEAWSDYVAQHTGSQAT